jgi:hypothetical protein
MNNMPMSIPIGINTINPLSDYSFNYNDNFDNGKGMNINYGISNNVKQSYLNNGFMYKNGK